MHPKSKEVWTRLWNGTRFLGAKGVGRSSLLGAVISPLLTARSPGAALLFSILPVYAVLSRGAFSMPDESQSPPGPAGAIVPPTEILARFLAVFPVSLLSFAASYIGKLVVERFYAPGFTSSIGFGAAMASASLLLAAVHLPFLAARGPGAGRKAAGAVFAAAGISAVLSALRKNSLYAALLLVLYSGNAQTLYLPLIGGAAIVAGLACLASWVLAHRRAKNPAARRGPR